MRKELSIKDQYLQKLFRIDDLILDKIEGELKSDDKWGVNIGGHELSILKFLIESFKVKSILEVGTLYAYSTYGMAKYLPENGQIISVEKNEDNFRKASELIRGSLHENKIELVHQDATVYLQNCHKKFDLIFIDANKSGYLNYLELALELTNTGGVVVGDNTFLFGHVYGGGLNKNMSNKNIEVMKEFNSKYTNQKEYTCTMIPTTEGMTLIKKN